MQSKNVFFRFQSQKPLVPFLYTFLQELVTSLFRRLVKPLKYEVDSFSKLFNFDFSHACILIPIQSIDVGFRAKKFLKDVKGFDSEKYEVKFQKFFIAIIEKLKIKSPLKSNLALGMLQS